MKTVYNTGNYETKTYIGRWFFRRNKTIVSTIADTLSTNFNPCGYDFTLLKIILSELNENDLVIFGFQRNVQAKSLMFLLPCYHREIIPCGSCSFIWKSKV